MELPTWDGQAVDASDPAALIDVLDDALRALKDHMGSESARTAGTGELLHAVEAASLLRFFAEAGQQYLVPVARTGGASWADLGSAMGVPAATARSRHEAGVALREEQIREAQRPSAPEGFTPSDHDVVRYDDQPAWRWDGDLELGIRYVQSRRDWFVAFRDEGDLDAGADDEPAASGSSRDDAWRFRIGALLGDRQADAEEARPGETLADFKVRLGS